MSWWLSPIKVLSKPFIRIHTLPDDPKSSLDGKLPVCYVLEQSEVSYNVILQRACLQSNLPDPYQPTHDALLDDKSFFAIHKRRGWFSKRAALEAHFDDLGKLIDAVCSGKVKDVQLVPATILIGRAPDKQSGFFKILFSENWPLGGRLRRMFQILIHGRNTSVEYSPPLSLKTVCDSTDDAEIIKRKVSRVMRVHFRRMRTAAIGPDLSHRRTQLDSIIRSRSVQRAIKDQAAKRKVSRSKVRAKARGYAKEIAADYNYRIVRILWSLLSWFWGKVYNGISIKHFDEVKKLAASDAQIVYVPCHRSHIDYLVLSYLLHDNHVAIPHIAAGINLNLPVAGTIIRGGGGFFLRRSFRAKPLYSAVFNEYVNMLCANGVPLEYFIEGTRSRTGRLLAPKGGMLAMTVRSYLRQGGRPLVFQPVYFGYEKLMEGNAYLGELSGQDKKPETLGGLFKSWRIIKRNYGRAHVNFGKAIHLEEMLGKTDPEWQRFASQEDPRPEWLNGLVDKLGRDILRNINACADVNPINLLAMAICASPKQAMAWTDLEQQIDFMRELLQALPYGPLVTITDMPTEDIIEHAQKLELVAIKKHALGDIVQLSESNAVLLTYYRNNVLHLFAPAALLASCFVNNARFSKGQLWRIAKVVYPYLREELFMHYSSRQFMENLEAAIDFMADKKFISKDGDTLRRAIGTSGEAMKLRLLGESLMPTFERYFITLAVLNSHGSGVLSTTELEKRCHLTAERMALLFDFKAPEFFDRSLFRRFIRLLRDRGLIRLDQNAKLAFEESISHRIEEAKTMLSKEVRHHIIAYASFQETRQQSDSDDKTEKN